MTGILLEVSPLIFNSKSFLWSLPSSHVVLIPLRCDVNREGNQKKQVHDSLSIFLLYRFTILGKSQTPKQLNASCSCLLSSRWILVLLSHSKEDWWQQMRGMRLIDSSYWPQIPAVCNLCRCILTVRCSLVHFFQTWSQIRGTLQNSASVCWSWFILSWLFWTLLVWSHHTFI